MALCALLWAVQGRAVDDGGYWPWYLPDYSNLQYAGSIGFLAVGAGKLFAANEMRAGLHYGYLPQTVAEAEIHTLTGKLTYQPWRLPVVAGTAVNPLYFGLSLTYVFGERYDNGYGNRWPAGYYPPASIYGAPYIGTRFSVGRLSAYLEASIMQEHLIDLYNNPNYIDVHTVTDLAVGVSYAFH